MWKGSAIQVKILSRDTKFMAGPGPPFQAGAKQRGGCARNTAAIRAASAERRGPRTQNFASGSGRGEPSFAPTAGAGYVSRTVLFFCATVAGYTWRGLGSPTHCSASRGPLHTVQNPPPNANHTPARGMRLNFVGMTGYRPCHPEYSEGPGHRTRGFVPGAAGFPFLGRRLRSA